MHHSTLSIGEHYRLGTSFVPSQRTGETPGAEEGNDESLGALRRHPSYEMDRASQ